ncbi:MAG: aminotransferase class III-fold pyridoxal phosphate-dependent enzyme [Candidatus Dormibacteraeota bacterium]|nr:aminotransferase class III-fold pyridoxal phosphate-dependent enzyme [Candidatus Dormibacteraeota bacterium]
MTSAAIQEWAEANPRSRQVFERERRVVPGGIVHDIRHSVPFPVAIASAAGSHKTDVDGHDLVCYVMGHGALMLGHNHPDVVAAIRGATGRLFHGGSSHELEAEWAERVVALVPSAELVHFTSSGTEATMLALQVARAYTGRPRVARLEGHFHGWHDALAIGIDQPFSALPPGIAPPMREAVAVVPNDLDAVAGALAGGDIAALILEPTGAAWGAAPLDHAFLAGLRELTLAAGTVLIFDEVVSGFRWSPGGVQQASGVTPDLTTMAKILAGGMPGGAVGGRAEIMEVLEFRPPPAVKVKHPGTHNAHPVCAAAGIATLDLVAGGSVQSRADETADWLRRELAGAFNRAEVPGFVYGGASTFRIVAGRERPAGDPTEWTHSVGVAGLKHGPRAEVVSAIQAAMLLEGVHLFHDNTGLVSPEHSQDDVERTVHGFERTLRRLKAERIL